MIKAKKSLYIEAEKRYGEKKEIFDAAKVKWEEENKDKPEESKPKFDLIEPKIDDEIGSFFKGGIMNLLNHCDKKHGQDSAGKVFAKLILDSIDVPDDSVAETKEEYHRKYVMSFMKNTKKVKDSAYEKFLKGTWMKSFPKSGEKLFNYVFDQMKTYMIESIREMVRKSN
jgi:hypothetical protein